MFEIDHPSPERLEEILRGDRLIRSKIGTAEDASFLVREYERRSAHTWWSNTSGLFTGALDILHKGHLEAFKRAHDYVDHVIVGIDPDETLRLKGLGRPVHDLATRLEMVAALESVSIVFPLPFALQQYTTTSENHKLFLDLTEKIRPHALITNELADPFWEEKKERASKLGIGYIGLQIPRPTSSTEIADKILGL